MKQKIYFYLCLLMMGAFVVGCNKDDVTNPEPPKGNVKEAAKVDLTKLNPNAVAYYANIKTAVFATGSNLPTTKSEEGTNPLIEKLESIEIEKEETSEDVSFFAMEEVEQDLFLSDWATVQAEQLSEKIAVNPELLAYVIADNEAIEEVMNEEIIETKGRKPSVRDNKVFFEKIQAKLAEKGKELEKQLAEQAKNETPETKMGITFGSNTIPQERMRTNLANYSRRGDFLISLPSHGNIYIYLDFGNDKFKVGHAGIINTNVTTSTGLTSYISIGAQAGDGVTDERLSYWSVKSYIVGIQKVKWTWRWRGFRSGFYRTATPVSNPGALADWAATFKGREYVKWYEFLTAKWAAPSRFTCTTLVWWCSKKAYDINVSDWWKPMISPSGLLTDESTYIRRVVN